MSADQKGVFGHSSTFYAILKRPRAILASDFVKKISFGIKVGKLFLKTAI